MASIKHMPTKYLFFILLIIVICKTSEEYTIEDVVPVPMPVVMERSEYKAAVEMNVIGARRRKLGPPFKICSVCRCCVKPFDPTTCLNMPCCYVIDCLLPKKPFGTCAFVPKTCNCSTCASP